MGVRGAKPPELRLIRPTVANVSLPDVQANLRAITALLDRQAATAFRTPPDIIAVVKANAYGHGAAAVSRALEDAGASMLTVWSALERWWFRRLGNSRSHPPRPRPGGPADFT